MAAKIGALSSATARNNVFRHSQNLRRPEIMYFEAMQICGSPSLCISRRCKPARGRRSVRRGHASLREAVEVFDGAMQVCEKLSKCSTGPCKSARGRRSVRRGHASLREAVEVFGEMTSRMRPRSSHFSGPKSLQKTQKPFIHALSTGNCTSFAALK